MRKVRGQVKGRRGTSGIKLSSAFRANPASQPLCSRGINIDLEQGRGMKVDQGAAERELKKSVPLKARRNEKRCRTRTTQWRQEPQPWRVA